MKFRHSLVEFIQLKNPRFDSSEIIQALEEIDMKESFISDEVAYNTLLSKYFLLRKLNNICEDFLEIMHKDDIVIRVSGEEVEIVCKNFLPFSLRGKRITRIVIERWINSRISNLNRIYMSKVYTYRNIGRDYNKVVVDSSAISIIDNFWVRKKDTLESWEEVTELRGSDRVLNEVALTGKINNFNRDFKDTTSLFTLKGAFPKAVFGNLLLKKDFNAEFEIAGYLIGKSLGINVAVAEEVGREVIACHIFTSEDLSMFHVSDILDNTDYIGNNLYEAVYKFFKMLGREDITKDLERLFILAYVTLNFDLHKENFGVMYNANNFEIQMLAPAYDFNEAFQPCEDINDFDCWIFNNLGNFMINNSDLLNNIPNTLKVVEEMEILSEESKKCVISRLRYLEKVS